MQFLNMFAQAAPAKTPLQRLRDDLAAAAQLAATMQRHIMAAGLQTVMQNELQVAAMLAEMEVYGMGAIQPMLLLTSVYTVCNHVWQAALRRCAAGVRLALYALPF